MTNGVILGGNFSLDEIGSFVNTWKLLTDEGKIKFEKLLKEKNDVAYNHFKNSYLSKYE